MNEKTSSNRKIILERTVAIIAYIHKQYNMLDKQGIHTNNLGSTALIMEYQQESTNEFYSIAQVEATILDEWSNISFNQWTDRTPIVLKSTYTDLKGRQDFDKKDLKYNKRNKNMITKLVKKAKSAIKEYKKNNS